MKLRSSTSFFVAALTVFSVLSPSHASTDLGQQQKALSIIADFASKLCQDIPLSHEKSSLDLSASAKAELKGIAKKVADLGFDGATKYSNTKEQGLLQQELAKALADSRTCRMKVWDDLKEKLLASRAASVPGPKLAKQSLPKVTPDEIVEERIREIQRAKREAYEIDLMPALMTSTETQDTLERVNREAIIYETTVNLPILHRYIRDHGKGITRSTFGEKMNAYAEKHTRLTEYLMSLVGRFHDNERLNDVDYVNEIYKETVQRLNERSEARSEFYTFIANLKRADFIGYK